MVSGKCQHYETKLLLAFKHSLLGGVLLPMNLINGTRPAAYKAVVTFIDAGLAFYSGLFSGQTLRQAQLLL